MGKGEEKTDSQTVVVLVFISEMSQKYWLFGIRGQNARTLAPGRSQVNLLRSRKREHSRKPCEFVDLIEACSPGPYIELFARGVRDGWTMWGNQADENYAPDWATYSNATGKTE